MNANKKAAVVTGGSSGIGKATAKAFLELGYIVVIADVNEDTLKRTAEEFGRWKDTLFYKKTDVSDPVSVKELAAFVKTNCGGVHTLVNCAGVFRGGLLHEAPEEDFDLQFNINVKGAYFMMKAMIPMMLERNCGAVVNISSASGIRGDYNAPLYCASKGAVISLTQAAALDYMEKGIRINCVSPSATATPMFLSGTNESVMNSFLNAFPDHKLGLPEQVADAVVFLASDKAAHICGHNLPVDGGLTNWNGQPKQDKNIKTTK